MKNDVTGTRGTETLGAAAGTATTSSRVAERAAAPVPSPPFIDRGKPVPDVYGRDVLRMVARDPEWLFAYWEVTPQRLRQLLPKPRGARDVSWHLKLVNLAGGSERLIPILHAAKSWYVPVRPCNRYRAELGFMNHRRFVPVLTSNIVRTPANALSSWCDNEWMVLRHTLAGMMHFPQESGLPSQSTPSSLDRVAPGQGGKWVMLERLAALIRTWTAVASTSRWNT